MVALIVTGGDGPTVEALRALACDADFTIAADSGLDAVRAASFVPDLIVGDFDSIADPDCLSLYEKRHIMKYPIDKDETDTELALRLAWERGADKVVLAGGGGGRLDHLLGLFSLFARPRSPDAWHTGRESAYRLGAGESGCFSVRIGDTVSVFPLMTGSKGMSSKGLRWPLEGLVWGKGAFGVSNRSISEQVEVVAGDEALLVILPSGAERLS